eukprot:gb/GEZJ01002583.1/.p1 GENE.gb/GEZJ01002583.1/~~gb/GEZJ01002583.1/.p1  ORF type:complete len:822 (+),score=140.86 gb/GEZJ01002583.1/:196-2466(+)
MSQPPFVSSRRTPQSTAADASSTPSAEQSVPARLRRRSSSWVDPSLLAQLRHPPLSKPTETEKPAQTEKPAEKPVDQPLQPKRTHQSATPTRAHSRSAYHEAAIHGGEQSRAQLQTSQLIIKGGLPSPAARPPNRASAADALEANPTVQRRTSHSDVPPASTRRSVRVRRLLDVDDSYVSDEDPDYEADGEPADEDDEQSYSSEDEPQRAARVVDLAYDAQEKQRQQALEHGADEIQPAHGNEMAQEDIPFDSDAYESDRLHYSDPGSVVDTEDEHQLPDFTQWRTKDIRDWLLAHDVNFNSAASKEELVGIVRAKVLQMEAMDEDQTPPVKQRQEASSRRRRGISAPSAADEDDDEVVFVSQRSKPLSNRNGSMFGKNKKRSRNRFRGIANSRFLAASTVLIMGVVLLLLWALALQAIFMTPVIPFCDTNSSSNYTKNGDLCRRCPQFGTCSDGQVLCDSGFVKDGAKCIRDHIFDRVVEQLVSSAAEILATLAGRAECGEAVPTTLTTEELREYLVAHFHEKRKNYPSFFRVDMDENAVLNSAVREALSVLSGELYDGVYVDSTGAFGSLDPTISFKCKLKRKAMEYLYEILSGLFVCALLLFVRVKIYLIRRRQRQCEAAHQRSLEVLRDQVIGFRNNEEDVAFVSDVILREEVLGRPSKQVIKMWKDVEEVLKSDPRVLRKHQTIRGMPSYTYEYVGSRRSSGSAFDSFSRRSSSFGSRASLDSLDLRSEADFDVTPQRGFGSYVMRFLDGR